MPGFAVRTTRFSGVDGVLLAQSPPPLGAHLGWSPFTYDPARAGLSPTACALAALREEARATLTAAAQTRQFIERPETLSLAPVTIQTARACGRQWTDANTVPIELPGLLRLALLAGQPDRAMAAGAQWVRLAGARDTVARGERLLRQVQWIVEHRPRASQMPLAWQPVSTLKTLGPGAVEQRIDALSYMLELSVMAGDVSRQLALVDTIRALVLALPSPRRDNFAEKILNANVVISLGLLYTPVDIHSPAVQTAVEQRLVQARQDLAAVDSKHRGRIIIPTTFKDFMYEPNYVRNDSLLVSLHVVPSTPIDAQHWSRRPDTAVTYPRRGVTTVVMKMGVCNAGESNACAKMYAAWRRWYATYAPRGVDFILLLQTSGSFGLSTRLSAPAEADSLRAYFVGQLGLPGIVGVVETPFTTLPDGRKVAAGGAPPYSGVVTRDGMYWPLGFEQIPFFLKNHQ